MSEPKVREYWTTREIKLVEAMYPNQPRALIEAAIPRHPFHCIRKKAAELKIRRRAVYRDWVDIAERHRPMIFAARP